MPAEMMTVEDNFLGLVPAYLCLMQVLGHSIPADEKVKRCPSLVGRAIASGHTRSIKVATIHVAGNLILTGPLR